uniref:Uncharacterized protein n=1 Tax=Rhizobium leguminosarum TaxID=384 RepID=A0A154ID75_RHILE|nr:hypothetical protein A4A59_27040 [Rhizobium leguminosarum]
MLIAQPMTGIINQDKIIGCAHGEMIADAPANFLQSRIQQNLNLAPANAWVFKDFLQLVNIIGRRGQFMKACVFEMIIGNKQCKSTCHGNVQPPK